MSPGRERDDSGRTLTFARPSFYGYTILCILLIRNSFEKKNEINDSRAKSIFECRELIQVERLVWNILIKLYVCKSSLSGTYVAGVWFALIWWVTPSLGLVSELFYDRFSKIGRIFCLVPIIWGWPSEFLWLSFWGSDNCLPMIN